MSRAMTRAHKTKRLAELRKSGRPKVVADLFEAACLRGNRTISELAGDLGVGVPMVHKWFAVKGSFSDPTVSSLERLCVAAGLEIVFVPKDSEEAVRKAVKLFS